jgi:hypothetical protein
VTAHAIRDGGETQMIHIVRAATELRHIDVRLFAKESGA